MSYRRIATVAATTLALGACEARPSPTPGTTVVQAAGTEAPRQSVSELERRAIERRAVEAIIWGMPAVNFELLTQEMVRIGAQWNQVVHWSRLPDWKHQTLTPNPDTTYFFSFYNTKDAGPVVLEVPQAGGDGSITGSVDDAWQTAVEDVGPAGFDKGKGGRYLILPPGYDETVPSGYIVLRSSTYAGFILLRSNTRSGNDADVVNAITYGKRAQVYPVSDVVHPQETVFIDASNDEYSNIIPYDLRFFESLNRFVQREPWLPRDRAMIETLKSIGIEKGKPFAPDAMTRDALKAAALEARAWLDAKYETSFIPYADSARWAVPLSPDLIEGMSTNFANPDSYPLDARAVVYSFAYFSAKHLGAGQFYLMTIKDKAGQSFDGGATYRLTVPANPPVTLYWSATVYDRATHAFIREMKTLSRSSLSPGLQKNADGSVDIWFAPTAPPGKESNWVPTKAGGQFEVLFRLYGPQKPLYDKTWKLPDIERVTTP